YTVSLSEDVYEYCDALHIRHIRHASVLASNIGFQVTVNQFTYRSVGASRNDSIFFLANAFANESRVRLVRILGANSSQISLPLYFLPHAFQMDWSNSFFCQSHPNARIYILGSVMMTEAFNISFL
ncbi:hypothetical protein EWB00_010302, partial [Schistosoma japonicum]